MILFKYFSPTPLNISLLRRGEIFFASTGELNDPTDLKLRIVLRGKPPLWSALSKQIYAMAWDKMPHSDLMSSQAKESFGLMMNNTIKSLGILAGTKAISIDGLENLFRKAAGVDLTGKDTSYQAIFLAVKTVIKSDLHRLIARRHAAACFTTTALSPSMWSTYADKGKGFCVAYRLKKNVLRIDSITKQFLKSKPHPHKPKVEQWWFEKSKPIKLIQAKYTRRTPEVNGFEELCGTFFFASDFDAQLLRRCKASLLPVKSSNALVAKHPSWNREAEYRALLEGSSRAYAGRTLSVEFNQILAVIIGAETSDPDIENIEEALRHLGSLQQEKTSIWLPILRASQIDKELSLEISPHGACTNKTKIGAVGILKLNHIKQDKPTEKALLKASRTVMKASNQRR